ncbi:S24 family peptidase [Eubacteriaceae bacterium ES2]|nr:S24 family peptidase [Eubacteriaceae bacterium ES2]
MINEKLRQLKKQSSMTTQELSIKSRIPLPTIHKLLSGETTNPKYNTLTAFLDALDHELTIQSIYEDESPLLSIMDRDILARYQTLSTEGKKFISDTLDQFSAYEHNEINFPNPEALRELPLYLLPASAGVGSYLDSDQYEFKSFPSEAVPDKAKYAIRVTGDSMEPAYYQDDIVFVEPVNQLNRGDVGIIIINGDAYIKQFRDNAFISFNPLYDSIIPNEYDTLRIVGRVLGRYSL